MAGTKLFPLVLFRWTKNGPIIHITSYSTHYMFLHCVLGGIVCKFCFGLVFLRPESIALSINGPHSKQNRLLIAFCVWAEVYLPAQVSQNNILRKKVPTMQLLNIVWLATLSNLLILGGEVRWERERNFQS